MHNCNSLCTETIIFFLQNGGEEESFPPIRIVGPAVDNTSFAQRVSEQSTGILQGGYNYTFTVSSSQQIYCHCYKFTVRYVHVYCRGIYCTCARFCWLWYELSELFLLSCGFMFQVFATTNLTALGLNGDGERASITVLVPVARECTHPSCNRFPFCNVRADNHP